MNLDSMVADKAADVQIVDALAHALVDGAQRRPAQATLPQRPSLLGLLRHALPPLPSSPYTARHS